MQKKIYVQKSKEPDGDNTEFRITEFFGLYNNLNIDDKIIIEVKNNSTEVEITGLISTPDSIKCCRDEAFWYKAFDFGFVYITRNDFDTIFNTTSLNNYVSIYFNNNCTYKEQT